jgi:hypothetical protein
MGLIANGLRCDSCGDVDAHVYYKKNAGPPPCPSCDGVRVVDWSHGQFPGVQGDGIKSFVPVDMGVLGYCDTREKYDRAEAIIKERFPGHTVNRVVESKADHGERIDAIKHRSWKQKKDNHLTPAIIAEVKEKSNAKAREARGKALAQNSNPAAAEKAARSDVGSASKSVGGWGK